MNLNKCEFDELEDMALRYPPWPYVFNLSTNTGFYIRICKSGFLSFFRSLDDVYLK